MLALTTYPDILIDWLQDIRNLRHLQHARTN